MEAGSLRDRVLGLFEPDVAQALVRFSEHIRQIEADYLIFMARKSLRLYDLLTTLGLPKTEKFVLSDRVLDIDPQPLANKNVALIDDTLIVGTTLAKTKRSLEETVTKRITSHVFCTNRDWWQRSIFDPDYALMELSDERTMAFCASEVRGLSVLAIPYLLEFPFTTPLSVRAGQLHQLFSTFEWEAHNLSTPRQEEWHAHTYTFLPSGDILSELERALGTPVANALDIVKVRAFARATSHRTRSTKVTFVPLVTLKPLSVNELERLFTCVLSALGREMEVRNLERSIGTPIAKMRLLQYVLSVAIGSRFLKSLERTIGDQPSLTFQSEEAIRHFGPWLIDDIRRLHSVAYKAIYESRDLSRKVTHISVAPTPPSILANIEDVLQRSSVRPQRIRNAPRQGPQNLLTDFGEIFLNFFDKHELPARLDAKAFGPQVLDDGFREAAHRNRLDVGVPWSEIVRYLRKSYPLRDKQNMSNVLSLLLDYWNDIGVSVPVLCVRDGVVLRAFRHGEDVKITNQELVMIREMAAGYLEGSGRESIPRLLFEKMIVALIRIGVARDWLTPVFGPSGDYVARVGYHLKGAVVFQPKRTQSLLAGPNGTWLSSYCLARGILKLAGRQYLPGDTLTANFDRPWAPREAKKLGRLFGMLAIDDGPLAKGRAQIVLATCVGPRETASAIEAELDIIQDWSNRALPSMTSSIRAAHPRAIDSALSMLRQSFAHEAVFSARMKYLAYLDNEAADISSACAVHLDNTNAIAADEWRSLWEPVIGATQPSDVALFEKALRTAASTTFHFGLCLLLLELCLIIAARSARGGTNKGAVNRFFDKMDGFLAQYAERLDLSPPVRRLIERVTALRDEDRLRAFDYREAWRFAMGRLQMLQGDVISDRDHLFALYRNPAFGVAHTYYHYMVWYDVIGSTGERFGLVGTERDDHVDKVLAFKEAVTTALRSLSSEYSRQRGELFVWNGTIQSRNDEKHIFISGPESLRRSFVESTMRAILREAVRLPRVRIRMVALQCSFAESSVWRTSTDTEVTGDRFWVHWARLRDQLKKSEEQHFNLEKNIVHLIGKDFIAANTITEFCTLGKKTNQQIRTSPDGFRLTTDVVGWNLEEVF